MKRILFVLALILFLASLLLLFHAPAAALVVVAILVGEWGYYFAILSLGLAIFAWRRSKVTALLALIGAALFVSPSLRAIRIAQSLPSRLDAAFGTTSDEKIFRIASRAKVKITTHIYADKLKLDLYQSKEASAAQPLIIMIHGGSWNRGDKKDLAALNYYLASENFAVAAINYRHAPQFQFPAEIDDVFRAIDSLKAHASEFNFDTTRIVLIGRSAGAQMALSAGYSGREPAIRGVVAFYPPTELIFGYEHPSARYLLDSGKVLREYLGGSPSEKRDQYIAASPINFVSEKTPATLLIHGGLDSVVWSVHSEMLNAKLEEANVPHFYLSLGWATHGCDANLNGPSGQLSRYAIDRFLRAAFR